EEILCRRVISAGYVVRAMNVTPVNHYPHSGNWRENDRSYLGCRNRLISTTLTTPAHAVPFGWLHTTARTAYALAKSRGQMTPSKKIVHSWMTGIVDSWKYRKRRTPMHRGSYGAYLR